VFEVTTGTSVDDPNGIKAILSIPVQVGETKPILKCPEDPIDVPQAESVRIDLAALCHVWTPEADQVDGLSWTAAFDDGSASGLAAATPQAGIVEVTASAGTDPGDTGTLRVAADNSAAGRITIRVIATPPPSLAPIRVSTLKAGESQTIDLARYLTPGVREPVPTVVSAQQLTNLDVQITSSGSSVTITTGPKVHGHAEFRVVMSDVAGDSGPGRQVQGRIALDVLGPPSVPGVPVKGNEVKDSKVSLDWRAAESNGSPIDYYEVQNTSGGTIRCRTNSCDFTGLRNGTAYRFRVRAHNAVGFSDWSGLSAPATPDETPELVGKVTLVEAGDGLLHIHWNPVKGKNGAEISYFVKWQGDGRTAFDSDLVVTGLDNHQRYTFTITPRNGFIAGGALTSAAFQPIGPPGQPGAPVITDQETPGSTGAVTLKWDGVDPNGPGGLRYTVFRDGVALPTCTKIAQTSCDNANLTYNGNVYTYTVQAYNKDGKPGGAASLMGGPSQWTAAGRPASWAGWTLTATGTNNQAKAVFSVPPSRGADSHVNVYADGAKVQTLAVSGDTEALVDVANNAATHTVVLEVCNEKGSCTQSAARTVQTYGPLAQGNIHSITPNIDGTRISWTIEADGNGNDATLTVVSDRGRSEQFAVPVGVGSFTTTALDLGYRQTETVTVTLADSSPVRGPVTATNAGTTADPPPPTVTGSRGAACSDDPAAGLPACDTGLFGGPKCTDVSCAFVHIVLTNWVDGVPGQAVFCSVNNAQGRPYNPNANTDTPDYFGNPGQTVSIHCVNGAGQSADTQFVW
ncbi:MAG: fibronectin type III domain-containing protein, partial [Nocardioides sp.]